MMMIKTLARIAVSVTVSTAGMINGSAGTPIQVTNSATGTILTDANGRSLYTFAKDSRGKSACNSDCTFNWPPLLADIETKAPARYSLITRDDGRMQWAYQDRPLYTWVNDHRPSDTTGDGFMNGAWHVARP